MNSKPRVLLAIFILIGAAVLLFGLIQLIPYRKKPQQPAGN